MVSEDKVDREALTLRVKDLKTRIQDLEKTPLVTGLSVKIEELKKNSADAAVIKAAQNHLQLWSRVRTGLYDLLEMMDLVAPPDSRSLDEDRCNWWVLQEDADEVETNLQKFLQTNA